MGRELADSTCEAVTVGVERAQPISSFIVKLADGRLVGRADFVDPPGDFAERILFHTEVDPSIRGRDLTALLLRAALEDSIRDGLAVVPVCPLFARYLNRRGDEFTADGGRFRSLARADILLVRRLVRGRP